VVDCVPDLAWVVGFVLADLEQHTFRYGLFLFQLGADYADYLDYLAVQRNAQSSRRDWDLNEIRVCFLVY